MKRTKKTMGVLLALGMLATQLIVPQTASAELVEEQIYFEDFNDVSSEEKTAWHEAYDAATAKPGQWYLYSGDVYTHNFALGNVDDTSEKRVPIPFGSTLDIANNKYELTFKLNHVQYEDSIWIVSVANSSYQPIEGEDKLASMGTNIYDIKIVFENKGWSIYRKAQTATDYTLLGSRTDKTDTVDGIFIRIWANQNKTDNIHSVDDICVKQIDKTTGDVIATVYNENFDDWTYEGDGKSVSTNIKGETTFYDKITTGRTLPRLIPVSSGSEDGLIGYIKKPTHKTNGNGVDNYMRFVFPEVLNSGKYVISFDWSNAQKSCDYIYLSDTDNGSATIIDGNSSYTVKGFRNMKLFIDTEAGTYQLNDGTVKAFPDGKFANGVGRIAFRQHLDSATATTTMIDNFKITKLTEQNPAISDEDIVITNSNGLVQFNTSKVDINLGNITVNFKNELNAETVNKENVVFAGGSNPEYNVIYENNKIIVSTASGKLEAATEYTLNISGIQTAGGETVDSKEFSFKTDSAEFDIESIYSEDFNNVSDDTLAAWATEFNSDTAVKGQWYAKGTTPTLAINTAAADKCLSTSAHVAGTNEYLYFKLPGNIVNDAISQYEISFDYYANGSWCDWFYVRNADTSAYMNMDFAKGWQKVTMTIDFDKQTWVVNGADCTHENIKSVLDKSDLTFMIRLHGNATAGASVKVDNLNVYKLSEKKELSEETFTISESSFLTENGKTTANVKLVINNPGVYNFTAFIASYGNDDSLQSVAAVPVSTTAGDTVKVIDNLSVDTDSNTDYCKVFIWDLTEGGLIPLTKAVSSK